MSWGWLYVAARSGLIARDGAMPFVAGSTAIYLGSPLKARPHTAGPFARLPRSSVGASFAQGAWIARD
jgi:hypothetical protein